MTVIYKLLPDEVWRAARAGGVFAGWGVDLKDGYIHLSTAAQAQETAARHFKDQAGLVLVAVEAEGLAGLKWEPSRGGDLFPHIYGDLPFSAVISEQAVSLRADGVPDLGFIAT